MLLSLSFMEVKTFSLRFSFSLFLCRISLTIPRKNSSELSCLSSESAMRSLTVNSLPSEESANSSVTTCDSIWGRTEGGRRVRRSL